MNFDKAFEHVVGLEGGYVDDPRDPGGETKYGIAKKFHPREDIKNMTLERAKEIYYKDYWIPAQCEKLEWPMSLYVFDAAVNQGVVPAVRMLQETVGTTPDGVIGPRTLAAVKAAGHEGELLYLVRRAFRYIGTINFNAFGRGWLKRLFAIAVFGAK
jgi:lysozyme family protein